jgi:divalent metal cation (Fe/Co/Zn/Cd) transporter
VLCEADRQTPQLGRAVILVLSGLGIAYVGIRQYADTPVEDRLWYAIVAGICVLGGVGWIVHAVALARRMGRQSDKIPRS